MSQPSSSSGLSQTSGGIADDEGCVAVFRESKRLKYSKDHESLATTTTSTTSSEAARASPQHNHEPSSPTPTTASSGGTGGPPAAPSQPPTMPQERAVAPATPSTSTATPADDGSSSIDEPPRIMSSSPEPQPQALLPEPSPPTTMVSETTTVEDNFGPGRNYEEEKATDEATANASNVAWEPTAKTFPFKLDGFQVEACKCLERGENVLVAAHTSAGKTVVAEYAIAMALASNQRVVYTSPIKALSNQKYRDFGNAFSEYKDEIGLMTGDVTKNPNASCLVMTTEILRNFLYKGHELLREVKYVIFDEVHYMKDKERGVIWEESIILLNPSIQLIFLSATISNANDFAAWVQDVKKGKPCKVVSTSHRPVPLEHYVYPPGSNGLYLIQDQHENFLSDNFAMSRKSFSCSNQEYNNQERRKRKGFTDLYRLLDLLRTQGDLPAIVFSFSRREVEHRASQLSQLNLNTEEEQEMVQEVFSNAIDLLNQDDRNLTVIQALLPLLTRGIGVHHSGLLPILKEITEILFGEGLIKVLFATETFAMGVNMPAKVVIFSSLQKFDGYENRWLLSGEYTQMSGRAGRRGLDRRGICIMMSKLELTEPTVRQMVKGDSNPLNSSFRLTYNMVLNLRRVDFASATQLIDKSFYRYVLNASVPDSQRKHKRLEAWVKQFEDQADFKKMNDYMKMDLLKQDIIENKVRKWVIDPRVLVGFLQPGRLVRMEVEGTDWGWGLVVNYRRRYVPDKFFVDVLLRVDADIEESGNLMLPRSSLVPRKALPPSKEKVVNSPMKVITQSDREFSSCTDPTSKTTSGSEQSSTVTSVDPTPKKNGCPVAEPEEPLPRCSTPPMPTSPTGLRKTPTTPSKTKSRLSNSAKKAAAETAAKSGSGGALLPPRKLTSGVVRFMTHCVKQIGLPRMRMPGMTERLTPEVSEHMMGLVAGKWPIAEMVPTLDPVFDLPLDRVTDPKELAQVRAQLGKLDEQVKEHPWRWENDEHQARCRKEYLEYTKKKEELEGAALELEATGSGRFKEQLKCKSVVLRRLGYLDDDDTLTPKGVFGCSIESVDELVITELLFEGVFNELTMEESVAILSAFLPHGKSTCKKQLTQPLRTAYDKLMEKARHLCQVQKEHRVEIEENTYTSQFKPNAIMVVLAWVEGKTFRECTEMTDDFEGNIVRMLRRIEELLRQLIDAVKSIGNEELVLKFTQGQSAITRGIAFAASLYIGEEEDRAEDDDDADDFADEDGDMHSAEERFDDEESLLSERTGTSQDVQPCIRHEDLGLESDPEETGTSDLP